VDLSVGRAYEYMVLVLRIDGDRTNVSTLGAKRRPVSKPVRISKLVSVTVSKNCERKSDHGQ
jgi:hypothetical protein